MVKDRECISGDCAASCGSFAVIDGYLLVYWGFTGEEEIFFCIERPTHSKDFSVYLKWRSTQLGHS